MANDGRYSGGKVDMSMSLSVVLMAQVIVFTCRMLGLGVGFSLPRRFNPPQTQFLLGLEGHGKVMRMGFDIS